MCNEKVPVSEDPKKPAKSGFRKPKGIPPKARQTAMGDHPARPTPFPRSRPRSAPSSEDLTVPEMDYRRREALDMPVPTSQNQRATQMLTSRTDVDSAAPTLLDPPVPGPSSPSSAPKRKNRPWVTQVAANYSGRLRKQMAAQLQARVVELTADFKAAQDSVPPVRREAEAEDEVELELEQEELEQVELGPPPLPVSADEAPAPPTRAEAVVDGQTLVWIQGDPTPLGVPYNEVPPHDLEGVDIYAEVHREVDDPRSPLDEEATTTFESPWGSRQENDLMAMDGHSEVDPYQDYELDNQRVTDPRMLAGPSRVEIRQVTSVKPDARLVLLTAPSTAFTKRGGKHSATVGQQKGLGL